MLLAATLTAGTITPAGAATEMANVTGVFTAMLALT